MLNSLILFVKLGYHILLATW